MNPRTFRYLNSLYPAAFTDNIPKQASFPWITKQRPWTMGSGPLKARAKHLRRLVNPLRTVMGKKVELAFSNFHVKNTRIGAAVLKKVSSINFERQPTPREINFESILSVLDDYGIIPTVKGPSYSELERRVLMSTPSNGQASLGVMVDPFSLTGYDTVITGKKGKYHNFVIEVALQLIHEAEVRDFRWEQFTPSFARALCEEFKALYILLFRLDGENPRAIWCPNGMQVPIEQAMGMEVKEALSNCGHVAYSYSKIMPTIKAQRGLSWLNCDFSGFDLHVPWNLQLVVWRAISERFGLPESLAVVLAAFNIAAPLYFPKDLHDLSKGYHLQPVLGIQRSGTGFFVLVNNVIALYVMDAVRKCFHEDGKGVVFGDNIVWATQTPVIEWVTRLKAEFEFVLKPKETFMSDDTIVLLRRFIDPETGKIEPVVMSRAHGALCSKMFDPSMASPELVAVMYRAQTVELLEAQATYGGYEGVIKYWLKRICPRKIEEQGEQRDLFMMDKTDAELGQLVSAQGSKYDTLTWVKRLRGIQDTTELLAQYV